jgi:branched-subunit amino acid aminotransferase/4-amino-4-deoxychorismate lyase
VHDHVFLNNEIIPVKDARISAVSAASLYGKGVFTTIAIYSDQPFLWEKHWRRFKNDAGKLKIDLAGNSEDKIKGALAQIVQDNSVVNGRARITVFDESQSNIWAAEATQRASLLITTGDLRPLPNNFRLTISPYRINSHSPLTGIKSCNYLDKILALDEAKAKGFDEAIQFNERGVVTSATMANVFWLDGDILCTPSLDTGCLPGTTREFVMENIACREVDAAMDEMLSADAIFLTSVGLGVAQIAEFESRLLEKIEHPILELLPKI